MDRAAETIGQTVQSYLRHPTVRGSRLAFVVEDDVAVAPLAGGPAQRITSGDGEAHHPALSPDGTRVAYSRRVGTAAEVWVASTEGDPPRQLTWLGGIAFVRGWSPDGRIVFSANAEEPFRQSFALYLVEPEGGPLERLPWSRVRDIAWADDGAVVLGRNTADPATWKRDRTGTAGRLWVDSTGDGTFRHVLGKLGGNLACPMFVGRRLWFLSDHEGIGNLYSSRRDGGDVRRHTRHDRFYARWAASDGIAIVYQHAGDVWRVTRGDGDAPVRVGVQVTRSGLRRRPRSRTAADGLTDARLDGSGDRLVIEARGQVTHLGTFHGGAYAVTPTGVRHRLPRPVGDGTVLLVSDEDGDDHLERHGPDGRHRIDAVVEGRVRALEVAPDGTQAVATTHRGGLWLVDLAADTAREVDRSRHGWIDDPDWSPDSRWVAYVHMTVSSHIREIRLLDTSTGEVRSLDEARFNEAQPTFDPTGRYLYFLSARGFDASVDVMGFELHFPRPVRAFAVTLRPDVPSPFDPARHTGDQPDGPPGVVEIEFDGLPRRIVGVPVPPGRYSRAIAVHEGVVLQSEPVEGAPPPSMTDTGRAANATLLLATLGDAATVTLHEQVRDVSAAGDRRRLLVRSQDSLRRIDVGREAPETAEPSDTGPGTGWVDLTRARVEIDPVAEWRQMFEEVWRRTREFYWTEDMAGVDWAAVREQYLPLVARLGARADLSDLIWELHGELAVSHAYEFVHERGKAGHEDPPVGMLAVDVTWHPRRRGWVVEDLFPGDVWEPGRASPLVGPGRDVQVGEVVRAVDGAMVRADVPLGRALAGRAGKDVDLTIGTGSSRRTVTVRPLGDDRPARYRTWVERNRRAVLAATEGRVGYLHVPNMDETGFGEFHRSWYAEFARDALIVDVRFNEGGFVSTLVLEKLRRRPIGVSRYRWREDEWYPRQATSGPVVAIANEHTGSDGDLFSHAFRHLGLGPLVGVRTWGGVIGIIQKEPLVDGSVVSHPEYAHWFPDVRWELEGSGAQPTHEVENRPQDDAAGRDRQLAAAIDLARSALERHRPLRATDVPVRRSRPTMDQGSGSPEPPGSGGDPGRSSRG